MISQVKRKFKQNEFSYIVFHRRSGEPRAHGPTEQEAWTALVQQKFSGRELSSDKDFQERLLNRVDHGAVPCGEHGVAIWAEHMPLNNARTLTG